MIGLGKEKDGLYVLQLNANAADVSGPPSAAATSASPSLFDLWHYRLGHISDSRLSFLHHQDPIITVLSNFYCTTCPLAKQRRLCFNDNSSLATKPFDLIHADIWGPFSVPTSLSHRYFLTIVDDCTRCTWVFLMKLKSETRQLLQNFFALVKTQFQTTIKCL